MSLTKKTSKKLLRIFHQPINIRSSWIDEPAKMQSTVDFLNWFDSTSSINETLKKAQRDWDERLTCFSKFPAMNRQTCLEIGFGAGRLIVPASKCFQTAIGVDIHSVFGRTREFLESQNVSNYRLIHRDKLEMIEANSIDFVYSFIVFQHFDSFAEVDYYLSNIKRVLSPEGYSHIFFGKCSGKSVRVTDERDFRNRECSLFIEPQYLRQYLQEMGFTLVEYQDTMKKRLDEPPCPTNDSGQARVLFRK